MSPLGVPQLKIDFSPKSAPLPQTVTQRMSPLGIAQWKIETGAKNKMPTPLAEGQENSFAPQMIFLGLRPGEWVFYFDTSFNFPLCHPKGAHSLGHRLGQLDTSGAKFNFPLWYLKGAHSLGAMGHVWG